jgi:hypothetical protein
MQGLQNCLEVNVDPRTKACHEIPRIFLSQGRYSSCPLSINNVHISEPSSTSGCTRNGGYGFRTTSASDKVMPSDKLIRDFYFRFMDDAVVNLDITSVRGFTNTVRRYTQLNPERDDRCGNPKTTSYCDSKHAVSIFCAVEFL